MKQILATTIDEPSLLMEHNRVLQWAQEVFEKAALGKVTEEQAAKMLVSGTNTLLRRLR